MLMENRDFFKSEKFIFISHRGASGEFPENTLQSFKRALEIFPHSVLEMDLRQTLDGEIVVSHDAAVDRVSNGTGYINKKSLDELKELDFGHNISLDMGKSFPFRNKGYKIPALKDVLEAFPGNRMILEIKERDAVFIQKIVSLLKNYDFLSSVIIGSFDDAVLRYVRKNFSNLFTCFGQVGVWFFLLKKKLHAPVFIKDKYRVVIVPEFSNGDRPEYLGKGVKQGFRLVDRVFINYAHKRGLKIFIWTINNRDNMRRLIRWGVDGILTDYPSRLKEVLIEEGVIQ